MNPISRNRRLANYIREVKGIYFVSLAILVVVSGLTAAKAWIVQLVVDGFKSGGADTGDLLMVCVTVVAVFGGSALLDWGYMILSRIASARLIVRIREDLFARLISQDLAYFSRRHSSDLTARVVNDVAAFDFAAVQAIQGAFRDAVTIVCLLGVLFFWDWQIAALCLGIVFVAALLLRAVNRRIARLGRKVQESLSGVAGQITEMIGGIDVILSFGLSSYWRDRFQKSNQQFYDDSLRSHKLGAQGTLIVNLIAAGTIATVLWIVGSALMRGDITEGEFGAFLATLYLLQAPAQGLGLNLQQFVRGLAAGDRAFELLNEFPEMKDPESPAPRKKVEGRVRFEGVSFRYADELTLDDVSLAVDPAELVVIVGDSGAGKSTVAKLAERFYDPESGRVTLDGTDLRELEREGLRRSISYVGQEVYLFDASLRFNLTIGRPDATDDEILTVIEAACLDEFLARLPEGLDTKIGERGARLSGGQRQRIAIARALLVPSAVLVLDEATSAVDMDLERKILQNIVDRYPERAIMAITHRLSLAEIADKVVVLKQGRVAEVGTASELAASGGEYHRLQQASRTGLQR